MIVGTEIVGNVALGGSYYPPVYIGGIELSGNGSARKESHIVPTGGITLSVGGIYDVKLRTVLNTAVQSLLRELREAIKKLKDFYHAGKSGQMYANINKIFLSGREEEEDYAWPNYPEDERMESPDTLIMHMIRGTLWGMYWDIALMCNTDNITMTSHEELECGWILDVTSPGFVGEEYDEDYSLSFLGLDNMIDITMINAGNRSNNEIKKIVRKEVVPAIYNVRCFFDLEE